MVRQPGFLARKPLEDGAFSSHVQFDSGAPTPSRPLIPFDEVAAALDGIPYMTRNEGWSIYQHVRQSGARDILELGCAHGVGACYMAAAMDDEGTVTTVDRADFLAHRDPSPNEVFDRTGLADRIKLVPVGDSSYNWWLRAKVAAQSDPDGNCAPLFDFCYLDGAHNFTLDGLAVVLVEKLLRPGGWLLLDDLDWTYELVAGEAWFEALVPGLSAEEIAEPHMQAVFDLIVRQLPSFSETKIENGKWGWAHKVAGATKQHQVIETSLPIGSALRLALRRVRSTSYRDMPVRSALRLALRRARGRTTGLPSR